MPVTLTAGVRENPSPCQHFLVTISRDGVQIQLEVDASSLNDPLTTEEMQAAMRLWGKYQRSKGKTLAQMVGGVIFPDIP